MFQYFPKINYGFSGGTFEVTDIFKSINLVFDRPDALLATTALPGERPDQVSNRLYSDPQYYWSLFLVNQVKNPLRDWAQTQDSYNTQIEAEYDGWVYQFANTSQFLPAEGSSGFTGNVLNRYEGTVLDNVFPGDLVIYETGSGPYSIKCYGAGGISLSDSCGAPQYGQSIVPDNLNQQQNIIQISSGDYFSCVLDSKGYIYAWGNIPLTTGFNKSGELYKSAVGGYKFINGCGNRIVAVNSNNTMECFGTCTDFNALSASGATGIAKTAWTSNYSGGVAIKSNGTAIGFSLAAPTSLYDVDCGYGYCVGILPTTFGLTAFGADVGNSNLVVPPGVLGITMVSVSYTHAAALDTSGQIYAWGNNSDGQCDSPAGTYKAVSAGKSHTAALDTNNNINIWGSIVYYGTAGCTGQTIEKITPTGLSGAFSNINSGYDHILLQGSGTNYKYVGVVDSVDIAYKRIFVKTYQFPDTTPVKLQDPSGTVVSIWRFNTSTNKYEQVQTIQHQLLSIDKYLDSTIYINQQGQILDVTTNSVWADVYLVNYQNATNNNEFITPRKQLMDVDLYNKSQIRQLSLGGVKNLETAIKNLFKNSNTNQIKISAL